MCAFIFTYIYIFVYTYIVSCRYIISCNIKIHLTTYASSSVSTTSLAQRTWTKNWMTPGWKRCNAVMDPWVIQPTIAIEKGQLIEEAVD